MTIAGSNFEAELKAMTTGIFQEKETEGNWERFDDAVNRITALTPANCSHPGFIPAIKKMKQGLVSCVKRKDGVQSAYHRR